MVTGTPGSGKTYYALRSIAEAADGGMPVATNVELRDDFAHKVARHHPIRWAIPGRRAAVEKRISKSVLVTDSLDDLMRVRVPGSKEERWLVVLDEAHGWLNARNWNAGDRERIIKWLSQHRKLGAKVLLISQDAENIDAQVRRLVEVEIRLRNLKNARVMGIPVSLGRNLMLAIWTWAGGQKMILRRQVMRLDWRRKLYNTHALPLSLDDDDTAPIWLPSDGSPAAGTAGAAKLTPAAAPGAVPAIARQDGGVTVAGIDVGPPLVSVPRPPELSAELVRAADPTTPHSSPSPAPATITGPRWAPAADLPRLPVPSSPPSVPERLAPPATAATSITSAAPPPPPESVPSAPGSGVSTVTTQDAERAPSRAPAPANDVMRARRGPGQSYRAR